MDRSMSGGAVMRRRRLQGAAVLVALVVLCLVAWSAISHAKFVRYRAYLIPSGSMSPTLAFGDKIGVRIEPGQRPRRGEIWVFYMPPAAKSAGSEGVKRVVGLPGDTVEVAGGRLIVNGRKVDEPYVGQAMSYVVPPVVLGEDEYFVLGDSRNASHDSHVWGVLPGQFLVGKVLARVWPPQRIAVPPR
jgi:signal peptidase I